MTQYVARLAYRPSTRHAALGPDFYDVVEPAAFPQHILRVRNQRWAARVGLDPLTDEEWIAHFGRFEPLPGGFRSHWRCATTAISSDPTIRSLATGAAFCSRNS